MILVVTNLWNFNLIIEVIVIVLGVMPRNCSLHIEHEQVRASAS